MSQSSRRTMGPAADITALVARIAIGAVAIAHGWQKLSQMGFSGTADMMAGMGVPVPPAAAAVAIVIEIGAGALLIAGFALPLAGVLLALQMAGAAFFGHFGAPLIGEGGWELPLVIGAAALALGFAGGRISVDRLLPWGKEKDTADTTPAPAGRAG